VDEQLKKRLIGATVLVSLAVIFIPMLLEREPVIDAGITTSNIPPQPKPVISETVLPVEKPVIEQPKPAETVISAPAPAPAPAQTPEPVVPDTPDPLPPSTIKPLDQKDVVENPVEQKPVAQPRVGLSSWVIQVGSFSNRENAEKLVQELRQMKYPAFIEQADVNRTSVFRVRVGPELDKGRAEKMLVDLNKDLKAKNLTGSLKSYP